MTHPGGAAGSTPGAKTATIHGQCARLTGIRPADAAAVAYTVGAEYDHVSLAAGSAPVSVEGSLHALRVLDYCLGHAHSKCLVQ